MRTGFLGAKAQRPQLPCAETECAEDYRDPHHGDTGQMGGTQPLTLPSSTRWDQLYETSRDGQPRGAPRGRAFYSLLAPMAHDSGDETYWLRKQRFVGSNMARHLLRIADGYYAAPGRIRRIALSMKYEEPEGLRGYRSRAYFPKGIRKRIEKTFDIKITEWPTSEDPDHANGLFMITHASGRYADPGGVHFDEPVSWMTLLIYLTPEAPVDCGTSLAKHRRTGLSGRPTRNDAARLQKPIGRILQILEDDGDTPSCWIETARIGNVYNRAVLFRAGMLHSSTRRFGNSLDTGRLFHSFHFGAS